MATVAEPLPRIATLPLISGSADCRLIIPETFVNTIVPPPAAVAFAIASRSEPGPESAVVVTWKVWQWALRQNRLADRKKPSVLGTDILVKARIILSVSLLPCTTHSDCEPSGQTQPEISRAYCARLQIWRNPGRYGAQCRECPLSNFKKKRRPNGRRLITEARLRIT